MIKHLSIILHKEAIKYFSSQQIRSFAKNRVMHTPFRLKLKKIFKYILFGLPVLWAYTKIFVLYFTKQYKKNDVAICITTTKGYYEKTIPQLIARLKYLGIDMHNVYVFEGGQNENKKVAKEFHHFQVNHNSFDLTALIAIVDFDLQPPYWLLLHDTLALTDTFKYIFPLLNPSGYECMPLRSHPSMNIGVYSKDYLIKNKSYLESHRNNNYSEQSLQYCKTKAIKEEDYLFTKSTNKQMINKLLSTIWSKSYVQYLGKVRKKELYPQLGIIKYKANHGLSKGDKYDIEI